MGVLSFTALSEQISNQPAELTRCIILHVLQLLLHGKGTRLSVDRIRDKIGDPR